MDKNNLYNFEKKANEYIEKPGSNYKQIQNIYNPNTDIQSNKYNYNYKQPDIKSELKPDIYNFNYKKTEDYVLKSPYLQPVKKKLSPVLYN